MRRKWAPWYRSRGDTPLGAAGGRMIFDHEQAQSDVYQEHDGMHHDYCDLTISIRSYAVIEFRVAMSMSV
jgi:hypothetical protein